MNNINQCFGYPLLIHVIAVLYHSTYFVNVLSILVLYEYSHVLVGSVFLFLIL